LRAAGVVGAPSHKDGVLFLMARSFRFVHLLAKKGPHAVNAEQSLAANPIASAQADAFDFAVV